MKTKFVVHEYGERKALEIAFGDVENWSPMFIGEFEGPGNVAGFDSSLIPNVSGRYLCDCSVEDLRGLRDAINDALGEHPVACKEETAELKATIERQKILMQELEDQGEETAELKATIERQKILMQELEDQGEEAAEEKDREICNLMMRLRASKEFSLNHINDLRAMLRHVGVPLQ